MNNVCTVLGKDRGQLVCCEPSSLLIKQSSLCATLLQRLVYWLQFTSLLAGNLKPNTIYSIKVCIPKVLNDTFDSVNIRI